MLCLDWPSTIKWKKILLTLKEIQMIDWTRPIRLINKEGDATLVTELRGCPFPKVVKITPPDLAMAETLTSLDVDGYSYSSDYPVVENIPVVRTITRYYLSHASDEGDLCNLYALYSTARSNIDFKYTGMIARIDWTITDGKTTNQSMTVLDSWNAATSN
jgi:hypothetical protein